MLKHLSCHVGVNIEADLQREKLQFFLSEQEYPGFLLTNLAKYVTDKLC